MDNSIERIVEMSSYAHLSHLKGAQITIEIIPIVDIPDIPVQCAY